MNTTLSVFTGLPCKQDEVWVVDACHGRFGTVWIWRHGSDDAPIFVQHCREDTSRLESCVNDRGYLPRCIRTADEATIECLSDLFGGTAVDIVHDPQASSSPTAHSLKADVLRAFCASRYFSDDVLHELRGSLLDKLCELTEGTLAAGCRYLHVNSPTISGIRIDDQADRLTLVLERTHRRGCMVLSLGVQEEYGHQGRFLYAGRPGTSASLDTLLPLDASDVVRAHHGLDVLLEWQAAGCPDTGRFGGFPVWAVPRRDAPPPPTSRRTLSLQAFHKESKMVKVVEVQEDVTYAALQVELSRVFEGLGQSYRFSIRLSGCAWLDVTQHPRDVDLDAATTTLADTLLAPGQRITYEDFDDRLRLTVLSRGTLTHTRSLAGGLRTSGR